MVNAMARNIENDRGKYKSGKSSVKKEPFEGFPAKYNRNGGVQSSL
jgi:hypothetical protein